MEGPSHIVMQLIFSDFQDQLVRGLSHRMNNILSLFHGYLGLLMDDRKLTPVLSEGLTRIRDGARDATDLMERITAMSRPASSTPREVDPAAFFRQLEPTLERLRTAKVGITVECPEDLPVLWGDPSRLKLAILELVRNACEAATSRVTIRVGASVTTVQPELFPTAGEPKDGQWLKIEIIDDGPGIPVSDAGRIFEPFFSTKKVKASIGLGLGVALGCAQQFGGTVEHRGTKTGTIFEMSLPARAQQQLRAVA
jgi:two-component system cell cycle sensor histidine kinase/response regulator CckA